MILISQDKHLRMDAEGRLFWQPDVTNPLPGSEVGRVVKGDGLLSPRIETTSTEPVQDAFAKALCDALAPLFALTDGDGFTDPAKTICERLQNALGILPRDALDDVIGALDEEGRKALRARKVRMGPLLVFLPDLNKPAAVALRAFLLSLWNGKSLPAEKPNDGMVSFSVEGKDVDPDYYRSIGYPVYGPRAIRVDMLDRVICAVYDGAKDGKFQAQHQMAEWLGSNINDLYAVLEAMGHTKMNDPIAEKVEAEEKATEAAAPAAEEKPAEDAAATAAAAQPVPQAKPELATFRLKRGKASAAKKEFKPREKREKKEFKNADKPKRDDKPRHKGGKKFDKDKRDKRDNEDRVYSARPKVQEESPFAILQQLKSGSKE